MASWATMGILMKNHGKSPMMMLGPPLPSTASTRPTVLLGFHAALSGRLRASPKWQELAGSLVWGNRHSQVAKNSVNACETSWKRKFGHHKHSKLPQCLHDCSEMTSEDLFKALNGWFFPSNIWIYGHGSKLKRHSGRSNGWSCLGHWTINLAGSVVAASPGIPQQPKPSAGLPELNGLSYIDHHLATNKKTWKSQTCLPPFHTP
jgi:hypothetical protein